VRGRLRTLPGSQSPEDVARVIAGIIDSRQPDVYTRPGLHEMVVGYFSKIGGDSTA